MTVSEELAGERYIVSSRLANRSHEFHNLAISFKSCSLGLRMHPLQLSASSPEIAYSTVDISARTYARTRKSGKTHKAREPHRPKPARRVSGYIERSRMLISEAMISAQSTSSALVSEATICCVYKSNFTLGKSPVSHPFTRP